MTSIHQDQIGKRRGLYATHLHYNSSPTLQAHSQPVKAPRGLVHKTDCAIKTLQYELAANVSVKLIGCLTYTIVL